MIKLDVCLEHCEHPENVDAVLKAMPPEEDLHATADLFRVLGDATRVRILHALSLRELCVCDLTAALGMTQSAISHQLRILRTSRLVRNRRDGKNVFYSLRDDHVVTLLENALEHVRESSK